MAALVFCGLFALTGCDGGAQAPSAAKTEASYSVSPTGAVAAGRQRVNDAYTFCINKVTERLKAPATARFSARDPNHEARDGSRYLFTGTVDSENGFGALLRADWGCDVRWTGSDFVADSVTVG
jgi:hypothetical protein